MKPMLRGFGLFESHGKRLASLSKGITCDCARVDKFLGKSVQMRPNDIFNRDWKSFLEGKKAKTLDMKTYAKCTHEKKPHNGHIACTCPGSTISFWFI